MSYINEALKKAQKEKDANHNGYMKSIGKSEKGKQRFNKGLLYSALTVILFIVLIIFLKSGGFFEQEKDKPLENDRDISVQTEPDKKENAAVVAEKIVEQIKPVNQVKRQEVEPQKKKAVPMTDKKNELYEQAVSFFKERKVEEARDNYLKILRMDPGHIRSLNDIGVLYIHDRKFDKAVIYLEKAVKLKPDNANSYYNLACAYALQNMKEKGMAYLIKAVETDEKVKDWIKEDRDLANLRGLPKFNAITR